MRYTILDFIRDFPNEDTCLEFLYEVQYENSLRCPKCRSIDKFYRISTRQAYSCKCGYQVYPRAGTIFHKSTTSLKNWFFAIFLMSSSKNGVSAKEIQRQVGVTYKCAWRMQRQIRKIMTQTDIELSGIVEVDEAYIGGRRKGSRGRGAAHKTPVVGMVERKGRVKAIVSPIVSTQSVGEIIDSGIHQKLSRIMTDDSPIYKRLSKRGYSHQSVNHSKYEYVKGEVHTNTIEGFWSQLKRSIRGTYVSVSPKYLPQYLDEFAFRYNHRKAWLPMFWVLLPLFASKE